jgi:CelD/BcsL family acetyltransferase involved in cellulose biosynthesis
MQILTPATPRSAAAAPRDVSTPVDIEFVDAPLSPEAWEAYETATRSYTCTRAFVEHFERPRQPTLALVRGTGGDVRAAFLFEHDGGASLRVLGRLYAPPPEAFRAFVEAAFARYPRASRIETDLVDAFAELHAAGRPTLWLREGVELRVSLAGGPEELSRSLSAEFLKRCSRHERKFLGSAPGARFSTRERGEIPREWIAEIVRLNHARMSAKKTDSVFDAHYEEGISAVARSHGCVTAMLDGERICAGAIVIRCGTESFAWVLAHDDAYAGFRPGKLCSLASMRHLAGRGVRTHHLLFGDSPYKRELGGNPAALASYLVLRSWSALTPRDVARVGRERAALLARRTVDAADALVARASSRPEPVKSLARAVVRRLRRVASAVPRLRRQRA